MKNILLTACGGDLAQGVLKALKISSLSLRIFGTDCNRTNLATAFFPEFDLSPKANEVGYQESLRKLLLRWEIDAVIPCCEPDLKALADYSGSKVPGTSAIVIAAPAVFLRVCLDKLKLFEALEGKVNQVKFWDPSGLTSFAQLSYPLVAKERSTSGSKGIHFCQGPNELSAALETMKQPVLQEQICNEGGEFTVGVFASKSGQFFAAAMRRELGPIGASWTAESVDDPDVEKYAVEVCRALGLRGSANVQLIKNRSGCFLLEVNPRFSSLVAFRAAFGFKDAEWSLIESLGLGEVQYEHSKKKKMKFQRYFGELLSSEEGPFSTLREWESIVPTLTL